jgi:hypothetical protein
MDIKDFVRNYQGNRPLGRLRQRWEDNIRMHFENRVSGYIGFTWL